MNITYRTILKYIIILVLIGGVVTGIILIFLPKPKPTAAHNSILEIEQHSFFKDNVYNTTMTRILGLMTEETNVKTKNSIQISINVIDSLYGLNNFIQGEVIYSDNTKTYEEKITELEKVKNTLKEKLSTYEDYINKEFNNFYLNVSSKTISSINEYALALMNQNKELLEIYFDFSELTIILFEDLKPTFVVNSWSNQLLNITQIWSKTLYDIFEGQGDNVNNYVTSSNILKSFMTTKLTPSSSRNFFSESTTIQPLLTAIIQINLQNLINVLGTGTGSPLTDAEIDYLNGISDSTIKSANQLVLNYLKGV